MRRLHPDAGHPQGAAVTRLHVMGTGRRLHVCLISPLGYGLYRPDSGLSFGGAEVQFFLLSRELARDPAYRVSVLTTVQAPPSEEQQGAVTVIARQGGGRLFNGSPAANGRRLSRWTGYGAAFADMLGQLRRIDADVYLHAGAGVEVGAYALMCRLLRRRFVYVVASSTDLGRPDLAVRGPLAWLYPIGVRLADAVVCRSHEQQDALLNRYRKNGTLIRTGHPSPAAHHPSPIAPHSKSTILWAGRVHPVKQPLMFLEAAQRLAEHPCEMVVMRDPAEPALLETVRSQAASIPNLTLFEDVPWNQVERHFARAKLFMNTSLLEGFPNTFVQAAWHEAPIVSWAVDPDGVLAGQRIGVCAEGSLDRLVAAAQALCADEDARASMSRRAAAYAQRTHDLSRAADAFKVLVRSLVNGAREASRHV